MNATLVVCALALGGWAMPEQVDPTPPLYEDLSIEPAYMPHYAVERREARLERTGSPTLDDGSTNSPRSAFGQRPVSQWPTRTMGSGTGQAGMMPAEPTNRTTGNMVPGMPLQPTAQAGPGVNSPLGGGPLAVGGLGMPASPTAANPFGGPGTGSGAAAAGGLTPMRPPAAYGLTAQNPPTPDKPFSNYKPAPTISPWMNLYRNDTANGTQDNYTGFVRPALDQQNANQHFAAQINTNSSKLQQQQSALQQSGQQVPVGAGLVNPQYFINYGNYYKFPPMPTSP